MKDLYTCLSKLVAELDRLPSDHPQWQGSPMRSDCVQVLHAVQQLYALDVATLPPAEQFTVEDIIPAGEFGSQPRQ